MFCETPPGRFLCCPFARARHGRKDGKESNQRLPQTGMTSGVYLASTPSPVISRMGSARA